MCGHTAKAVWQALRRDPPNSAYCPSRIHSFPCGADYSAHVQSGAGAATGQDNRAYSPRFLWEAFFSVHWVGLWLVCLATALMLLVGCTATSLGVSGTPKDAQSANVEYRPSAELQPEPLIKAVIAEEDQQPERSDTSPPPKPPRVEAQTQPQPWKSDATSGGSLKESKDSAGKQWEDQRVQQAAMQLAGKNPGVIKLKVCYDINDDEWWVVLFEDHGAMIDLKPFVWNRETGQLEPYLVVRQISSDRLQVHLNEDDPSRPCRVFDPPPH